MDVKHTLGDELVGRTNAANTQVSILGQEVLSKSLKDEDVEESVGRRCT